MRQLADGWFSQSACFLTWAPVSQVRTLRLCAIFLERRAAPPQEGGIPYLFNRSDLPHKLQNSPIVYKTNVILRTPLRHPLRVTTVCCESHRPGKQAAGQSILQCLTSYCKFTHLFNIIFSDLRLAKSNIISSDVDKNLVEFTFSISQHF